jgi:hypothetical protein
VAPATTPVGYRDAVVPFKGWLYRTSVRQRHRDGNIHVDPETEIERALDRARTSGS